MCRVLVVSCAVVALSGCGGGAGGARPDARVVPVAEQVRQALADSLKRPGLPDMASARRPRLPFVAVAACSGPTGGGAGRYECATTPRGRRGVRSVIVEVRRDGRWSTEPLTAQATFRGRKTTAVTSVWGIGIRLP